MSILKRGDGGGLLRKPESDGLMGAEPGECCCSEDNCPTCGVGQRNVITANGFTRWSTSGSSLLFDYNTYEMHAQDLSILEDYWGYLVNISGDAATGFESCFAPTTTQAALQTTGIARCSGGKISSITGSVKFPKVLVTDVIRNVATISHPTPPTVDLAAQTITIPYQIDYDWGEGVRTSTGSITVVIDIVCEDTYYRRLLNGTLTINGSLEVAGSFCIGCETPNRTWDLDTPSALGIASSEIISNVCAGRENDPIYDYTAGLNMSEYPAVVGGSSSSDPLSDGVVGAGILYHPYAESVTLYPNKLGYRSRVPEGDLNQQCNNCDLTMEAALNWSNPTPNPQ